ncbi:Uncharacterized protein FWK35_00012263 [Aphis craccivora]|uniref:Uncharacterized protein n=1 Tax=Aphis craccivora TaxID=307492 RepID=A0A6G0YBX1_APHCR|nr:Uncharacterized protein FWK35_00012263 [Aphis craccivora]
MILKFGSLINLWSMRFKAKHRISKIEANTSSTLGRNIEFSPPQSVVDIDMFIEIELFDSLWKYSWINIKGTRY